MHPMDMKMDFNKLVYRFGLNCLNYKLASLLLEKLSSFMLNNSIKKDTKVCLFLKRYKLKKSYVKKQNNIKQLLNIFLCNREQMLLKFRYAEYLRRKLRLLRATKVSIDSLHKIIFLYKNRYLIENLDRIYKSFISELNYTKIFLKENDCYFIDDISKNYIFVEKLLKYKMRLLRFKKITSFQNSLIRHKLMLLHIKYNNLKLLSIKALVSRISYSIKNYDKIKKIINFSDLIKYDKMKLNNRFYSLKK